MKFVRFPSDSKNRLINLKQVTMIQFLLLDPAMVFEIDTTEHLVQIHLTTRETVEFRATPQEVHNVIHG